jgi:hypothetical protein
MGFKFDGNQIILRADQRDKLKNMLGTQFQSVFGQKGTFKEGGPFSYGKPPRKGSVADLAAKRRKEQDRKTPAIEPKDQMVGNAKVTKDVKEGGEKYKIKTIGSDINPATNKRADYYISPSTGKKVYKDGVKKGDHESPNSGEHKPKAEGQIAQAIMKEFGLK